VELKDGFAQAVSVTVHPLERFCGTEIRLTITEGRKHIVRRMAKTVGLKLLHLHRERVGCLTMKGIEEVGSIRLLDKAEVMELWKQAGGFERVCWNRILSLIKVVRFRRLKSQEPFWRLEEWFARHNLTFLISSPLFEELTQEIDFTTTTEQDEEMEDE
jgi:hypothetical protein